MNASELFVKCLEEEGVKHIFGVPGEENQDFLFAIEESSIKFIPTRHEQGAAFMANVQGRLTGKAGVCLSTLGPGATNLLTGIADANLDKAPLVAITGQGSTKRMHHESHQMIDVMQMFGKITKYSTSISRAEIIPEVVRAAFKFAEREKPGATHIELPEDVAKVMVESNSTVVPKKNVRRSAPNKEALTEVQALLAKSKKPLLLAGNGAIRSSASSALCSFTKKHNIPVVSTFMGKGAIPASDTRHIGTVGLGFKDYIIEAFEQADLVLAIGYDIAEYDPLHWNVGEEKKIVHIDFEEAPVYREYNPTVEIIGDIAGTLNLLSSGSDLKFDLDWVKPIKENIDSSINNYKQEDDSMVFHTPGVLHAVREVLPDDGLVISDVGSHKMWIARNFPCETPNGCIISNGLASMGISLPGGVAANLNNPDQAIISIMGDGGALMNIQEIETAKRLGLGFIILILNDNNYGLIKWKQQMDESKDYGTNLTNPDFVKLAESFHIKGYKPTSIKEFKKQLQSAIKEKELALFEVPISTDVNNELIEELKGYFS